MRKILSKLNKLLYYFCFIYFFIFSMLFAYFYNAISSIEKKEIESLKKENTSLIYDSSNRLLENINESKSGEIKYSDLPTHLINALISIEDRNFFYHDGISYSSIIRSLLNNIFTSSRQGGSTLTQQLVKNLLLNSEVSYKRKIQEAYLATILEKNYTKNELLELYFNRIYFEPTTPGIKYAAYRYFNKDVSSLNINECALLVGLVKSPSLYNPFKYIDKAHERKNIVLKCMYEEKYITYEEFSSCYKIHASSFVIKKGEQYKEKNFKYQAYLDVVYEEAERITGYSPFSKAMKIETYLNTDLQNYLDSIQNGDIISFKDELTQISSAVIENKTGGIVGLIGGRNYNGMRLYNRAYHMFRQPASTLKPIFTYALAMEYLNYNEYSLIEDKPYTYPNTSITVNNADKKYLGNISITDALGFSRNTSTLYTLEKVINKIGENKTIQYLKDIGIMDEGTFSYPYAIGGMTYGTSPINLAGAYSIIPRNGIYIKPSVIKKITYIDNNEIVYNHENEKQIKVLKEESCYLISSCLKNVRNGNYLNINQAFPSNIDCVGKTGTNAYDKAVINKYNYPINADRDSWFAGYSSSYTISCWTGFDQPLIDEKTYFGSNDERRKYSKYLFKNIMNKIGNKKETLLKLPSTMIKQNVVITENGLYLPSSFVPENKIKTVSLLKENKVENQLPYPLFNTFVPYSIIKIENELLISLPIIKEDIYKDILGEKGYLIKYLDIDNNTYSEFYESNEFMIPIYNDLFEIEIMETYKNSTSIHGDAYTYSTLI